MGLACYSYSALVTTIILLLLLTSSCDQPELDQTQWIKDSYQIVFQDDFNIGNLDTTKWRTKTENPKPYDRVLPRGNCNYNNAAILQDSNIQIKNSTLHLIAKKEINTYKGIVSGPKGENIGCDFIGGENFKMEQQYTSASISAKKGYNHGFFECRAKIPSTPGLYPVLWLWHHDELVLFEFFGNSQKHFVSAHNKGKYVTKQFSQVPDYSDAYHIYACLWTPDVIRWYLDGEQIWSIRSVEDDKTIDTQLADNIDPTNPITNREAFPDSINRWLSPNISLRVYEWAETVADEQLPDTLSIDYIRIYQENE